MAKSTHYLLFFFIPSLVLAGGAGQVCLLALKPDLNNNGIVDFRDVWMVGHSFNFSKNNPRFIQESDINCDNKVDEIDWNYVWKAYGKRYPIFDEIDYVDITFTGTDTMFFVESKDVITSAVSLRTNKNEGVFVPPASLKITQTITPNNGLGLKSKLVNEVFHIKNGKGFPKTFPITFIPEKTGEYQFTTLVEIERGNKVIQRDTTINVLSKKKPNFSVSTQLSYSQNWCFQKELKSYLYIQAKVKGKDSINTNQIAIKDRDSERSYDFYLKDGTVQDLPYMENTYLGARIWVTPEFIKNKQCKEGYLEVTSRDHTITTDPIKFCAKSIKKEAMPFVEQLTRQQTDKDTPFGMQKGIFHCNQNISIHLAKNFSRRQLESLLKRNNGKIVLYQPKIELYFVEPNDPTLDSEWQILRGKLKNNPGIISISQPHGTNQGFVDDQHRL
jgi:hypothetical protein